MRHFLLYLVSIFLLSNVSSFAADRYWVGGSGNWNDQVHWSEQSGGNLGATVPTINDNVFFDDYSFSEDNQTVYITKKASCQNFNWNLTSFNPILKGDDNAKLTVAGSFIINKKIQNKFLGDIEFSSNQNNNVISADSLNSNIIFNGNGSWLLNSDLKTTNNIILKQGTLSTNNKNIDCSEFKGSGKLNRSLILGKSNVNVDTWNFKNVKNLNFEAQKSNLVFKSDVDVKSLNITKLTYNKITNKSGSKAGIVASFTHTDGCHDANNGTITISVTSTGTAPYKYSYMNTGDGTGDDYTTDDLSHTFISMSPATYSTYVEDSQTHSDNQDVTISNPSAISITQVDSVNPTTPTSTDGSITVTTVSGGTSGYTYSIGGAYQAGNNFSSLTQGDYPVSVKDANDCEQAGPTIHLIGAGGVFSLDSVVTQVTSKGTTGSITIYTVNGVGTVQFSIDGGAHWEADNDGGDADASNGIYKYTNKDATAQYTVQVKDDDGTIVFDKNPVKFKGVLSIISVDVTDVSGCFGDANGEIQIHYSGATGTPYFSINNGSTWQTDSVFSDLVAGNYNIKVYDDNDNVTWGSNPVAVNEPAELVIDSTTHTNYTCHDDGDGTIHVYATGGSGNLTYRLTNNPLVEQVNNGYFNNVSGGSYTLTVTDDNGCYKKTDKTNITNPDTISINSVDISPVFPDLICFNDSTASITITATGGTSPLFYSIDSANTWQVYPDSVFNDLPAGDYNVFVKDANNCPSSEGKSWGKEIISENNEIVISDIVISDVKCNGGSDGSINITASGGTGTLNYSIDNGVTYPNTTGIFNGLPADTFYVKVKDGFECTSIVDTVEITEPPELTITIDSTHNVNCNGGSEGAVYTTTTGGISPYTYSWTNTGQTTEDITGLTANTYAVTVTDAHGCTATNSVTITEPAALTITIDSTHNVNCNGGSDGAVYTTTTGGTAPYTYSWTNTGQITEDITGLTANTYAVTVTDANGCTANNSTTITEPAVLVVTIDSTHNVNCKGDSDGEVYTTTTGGTAPYTYSWTNTGQKTEDITGLIANTYAVTVTDAHGCTATNNTTITEPPELTITIDSTHNVNCNGGSEGAVYTTITGGISPYTYSWTNTGQTTEDITGLTANTYAVTVTDAHGCTATNSVTITEPAALTITIDSTHNVNCNGGSDGAVYTTITGGTAPYTYLWSNTGQTAEDITGLSPNTYAVTVTDANGCTANNSATITEPAVLIVTIDSTHNVNCKGDSDGAVYTTVSGGTAPYIYSWSNTAQTTGDITGLTASTYAVTVTDAHGCTATNNTTITEPALELTITIDSTHNVNCNGGSEGAIYTTTTGGTAPYTYSWTNTGQTSEDITGLTANTYAVTVTDAHGCTATNNTTITEPALLTITVDSTNNVTCNSDNDGAVYTTVSGGTAPYTYSWSNTGQTTEDITGLSPNTYAVTVTDANGCTANNSATITEPAVLIVKIDSTHNVNCKGDSDGEVYTTTTGGTAPYTYSWTNTGQTTEDITGLTANTYAVTVTDAHGCTATNNTTITEPALELTITIDSTHNVHCNGNSDGGVYTTVSGGTAPYIYSWSNTAQTTEDITGLTANIYDVTVTDANGCTATNSSTITEPALLVVVIDSTHNVTCNGDGDGTVYTTSSGGTAPYTYSWTNTGQTTEDISGLTPNTYDVTVTDAHGCKATNSAKITQPDALTVSFDAWGNILCNGDSTGYITISTHGGTTPYAYQWYRDVALTDIIAGETNATINNLPADTFYVEVTDAHGCTVATNKILIEPDTRMSVTIQSYTDVACFGELTGNATALASDGTPAYSYQWYSDAGLTTPIDGETNATINNLSAGPYYVQVIDANGCDDDTLVTISQPDSALTASATDDALNCYGDTTGTSIATAAGGTTPYAYQWFRDAGLTDAIVGETNDTILNLSQATYYVEITDFNGCTASDDAIITEPSELVSTIIDSTMSCGSFPVIEAGQTFLPDGTGETYTSTLTYSDFEDEDTVQAASDIESICMNLEHSYTGDLTLKLECPNGQFVILADQVASNNYLGEPVRKVGEFPDLNTVAGTGYSYCFSPTGITTWAVAADDTTYSYTDNDGNPHTDQAFIPAGTYKAESSFDDLIGCPLNGDWKIKVTDNNEYDNGYLFSWGLNFNPDIFPPNYSNGRAAVSTSGGIPDYTFLWSNGHTNDTITDLSADYYTVTVTDANGCKSEATAHIKDVDLQTDSVVTDVVCSGDNTGSATVTATGGNEPYLYQWEDGFTGQTHNSLSSGTYKITVTDNNSCEYVDSVTIGYSHLLTAIFTDSSQTSCNSATTGSHFGSATITPNGTGPYSYLWSSGETDSVATQLVAGWNYVTVTDISCSYSDSIYISEPTELTAIISGTDVLCNGDTTGTAIVTPTGGTPFTVGNPYSYTWSDGQIDSTAVNLGAGTYQVTVVDSNMCGVVTSVDIFENDSITATYTTTPSGCGDSTGTATVSNILGGVGPYTVTWSHSSWSGDSVGTTINNLWVDFYDVTITDVNGCTKDTTITIEDNSTLEVVVDTIINVSCYGMCDGMAQVSGTLGFAPYSAVWSNGDITGTANSLCAGSYTVTVTDANTCSSVATIEITEPDELTDTIKFTKSIVCSSDTVADLSVITQGGTRPYVYLWKDGLSQVVSTDSSANNLKAGTYYLTVTDANNCQTTDSVTFIQPMPMGITLSNGNTHCPEDSSGWSKVDVTGGVLPYTYNWTIVGDHDSVLVNGNTDSIGNLAVNLYKIEIIDSLGCVHIDTVEIQDDSNVDFKTNILNNITCTGRCDGSAKVFDMAGGTSPYSFAWGNGETTETANSLCVGLTTITVTDAATCKRVKTVNITDEDVLTAYITHSNDFSHNGEQCTGSATVHASGGNSPYTYLWNDQAATTDSSAYHLCVGVYTVTVLDSNPYTSCQFVDSVEITNDILRYDTVQILYEACYGDSIGSVTVQAHGGFPGAYNYAWANTDWSSYPTADSLTQSISNLKAGWYYLTITDAGTGVLTDSIEIKEPNQYIPAYTIDSTHCSTPTGILSVNELLSTGGTSPFNYGWSNAGWSSYPNADSTGMSIRNLSVGKYFVTITDANGCIVNDSIDMPDNSKFKLNPRIITPVQCYGWSNGSAYANPNNGVAPYIFNWDDASVTDTITKLMSGTYHVTVTDNETCERIDSVTLSQPDQITFSIKDTVPINCYDSCTGAITVYNVNGGNTGSYSYILKKGFDNTEYTTPKLDNICSGNYQILVKDILGCLSDGLGYEVVSPTEMQPIFDTHNASCNANVDNGSISVSVTGGTPFMVASPTYDYLWSNGETTKDISNLYSGNYYLTVTDSNKCVKVDSVIVGADTSVYVFAGIYNSDVTDSVVCPGSSVKLQAGGTNDSVIWIPASLIEGRNDTIIPVAIPDQNPTTYYVKAYKGTCYNTDSITIGLHPLIQVDAGEDTTVYKGIQVHLLASGGIIDSTTYQWSGLNFVANQDSINPIVAPQQDTSVYVVIAKTGYCSTSDSVRIFVLDKTSSFGFTPNGDGHNDTWMIPGVTGEIKIYNRWGNIVYKASDNKPWDGRTNKGKDLPIGTYYYVITSPEMNEPLKGIVTILR